MGGLLTVQVKLSQEVPAHSQAGASSTYDSDFAIYKPLLACVLSSEPWCRKYFRKNVIIGAKNLETSVPTGNSISRVWPSVLGFNIFLAM